MPARTKVLLLEGGPRVLPAYSEDLSRKAQQQLEHLGVEVHTSSMVTCIDPGMVWVGEKSIPAQVVLWAAWSRSLPAGRQAGKPVDRAGRVQVQPDLSLPTIPKCS